MNTVTFQSTLCRMESRRTKHLNQAVHFQFQSHTRLFLLTFTDECPQSANALSISIWIPTFCPFCGYLFVIPVYQNLLELLFLTLIRFLPPSLSGVLGKHTHHQFLPWMKLLSINQIMEVKLGHHSTFDSSVSLYPDKSPHRKCNSL